MEYPSYSLKTRGHLIEKLQFGAKFDALIVGGGIVGAGLARELAIRGISTLLVEKNDFASGTSSKSSKLIHGGLRYLEMYDFHLVFEALSERHWLLESHPHLVQPLEFNIPLYQKKHAPKASRSSLLLGAGLWLYDALSFFRTPFFHGRHKKDELLKLFPNLRAEGLKGSYYYADAMMLDDELVLETIYDAHRRGATCLNYMQAVQVMQKNSNGFYEVYVQDALKNSDNNLLENRPVMIQAKEVIVCVGPWTERFGYHVQKGASKKLKPSKGVHLILPWDKFPVDRCLVMYAPDGRIVFAIPRKDLGAGAQVVIIGTTDSPEKESPEKAKATQDDIEYLLSVLSEYFPGSKLNRQDIIMTYAGVRPLIDDGSESEAKTSREHEIWRNPAGVVFMAGGKYTTFRKISQEIADFAFPKSKPNETESKTVLSKPSDYAKRLQGKKIWGKFTDQWINWKLEHHAPCNLSDVVFRRLPLWMAGKQISNEVLHEVAYLCKAYFDWSEERTHSEIETVKRELSQGFAE